MPFPWAPVLMGAGTLLSQIWNSAEAAKNRRFQERMSSTAHQREVADLRAAGINPMLSKMGGGASSPSGDRAQIEDLGRGVGAALQIQLLKKQAGLLDAQTDREVATTQGIQVANQEAHSGMEFRLQSVRNAADLSALTLEERRRLLPFAVKRAQAELKSLASSAEAQRARGVLDDLDSVRAMNEAEFERRLGESSPAMRTLLLIVRSLR